ncbi:MAG: T9SS type A sorting domain-containing protein [Flavobacteriales bacterium]|jgi:hypothetical protein|nr:T9SS type A sorting domain-containing protein [Flavobacteriales bacterium]
MKELLFCFMALGALVIKAQYVERYAIGNAGSTIEGRGVILSSTVGESLVEAHSTGSFILLQGYQQAEATFSSVNNREVNVDFRLYPNPTKAVAKLELNSKNERIDGLVSVYALNGQLISSENINCYGSCTAKLDLTQLKSGGYIVKILNANFEVVASIPLIKE